MGILLRYTFVTWLINFIKLMVPLVYWNTLVPIRNLLLLLIKKGTKGSMKGIGSDSDREDLFVKNDAEFESDVYEEDINLRAERRTCQRRKRRERIPNDPTEVPLGKVGPDLGFEETKIVDKSL
ncbi:hypothetical protein BC332_24164 [Capsicum chinense]|nr:hypothetical protein BC332_24164 [Capsicum chinense]